MLHQPPRTKRANGQPAMGLPGDAERFCGVRYGPSRGASRGKCTGRPFGGDCPCRPYRRARVTRPHGRGCASLDPCGIGTWSPQWPENHSLRVQNREKRLVPADSGHSPFEPIELVTASMTVGERQWGMIARSLRDGLHGGQAAPRAAVRTDWCQDLAYGLCGSAGWPRRRLPAPPSAPRKERNDVPVINTCKQDFCESL